MIFVVRERHQSLPDVNLYNSFNFEVKSTTANASTPTTQEEGAGSYGRDNPGERRTIDQARALGIHIMHTSALMLRVPTAMRWVRDLGPKNNAIAQNELEDWFTRRCSGKIRQ